jgi:CheY-like chemotaxis protein
MTRVVVLDDSPVIVEAVSKVISVHFPATEIIKLTVPEHLFSYVSKDVDLVISDQVMPGMTGVEVIRKFRGNDCLHHDIIITGSLSEVPKILCNDRDHSPIQVFTKPINVALFVEYVRSILTLG